MTTDPLGAVQKFTSTDVERKPTAGNIVIRLTYDDMDNVMNAESLSGAVALSSCDRLGQATPSVRLAETSGGRVAAAGTPG